VFSSLNAFLSGLPPASLATLADHLTPIDLTLGAVIYRIEAPVEWVYFPENSLLSMLSASTDGESVETSMVGIEGAAGLLEACGSGVSSVECIVQVNGRAHRAPAAAFRKLESSDPDLSRLAWRMNELQLAESRQSGLCQAMHVVEQRFARWVLETDERCGGRELLPITQEFLAAMLGVQRTTVTAFAMQLQKAGMIRYARGKLEIVDREALEARACECHRACQSQRTRLGFVPLRLIGEAGTDV
jgi:CRP-like cAMP-binding protein